MKKLLTILVATGTLYCWAHPSVRMHYEDFQNIFNGYGDEAFKELSYKISSGIDNELPILFRQQIGKVPGNHRILGHGWTLNDSIPRRILASLSKAYPGKEKEIIELWQGFARKLIEESMRLTGLPKNQATALASMLYDIHLLGDFEPGNKELMYVLSPDDIVKNIYKNIDTLFKNKPEYAGMIRKSLQRVLKAGWKDKQLEAQSLMTELYNLRMGDMLKTTLGNSLKTQYSIDRAIAANASRAARPISKIAGISRISRKAADLGKRPGTKFMRGMLQEHVIDGKAVTTLSVPIPPAVKAGVSTGVMTLIFTEGVTVYKFSNEKITEDEFIRESAKNCGAAITVGTATFVLVALGGTPTSLAVIGVGITAELIYEVAFDHVCKEFATPTITMEDLLGKLPTELQRRRGAFNHDDFQSFLEVNQKHLSILEIIDTQEQESILGVHRKKNSILDIGEDKKSQLEIGD